MQRYLIEREIPGAGDLAPAEVRAIATKSNEVLAAMAPRAQWVESYVTDDKIYCVYLAEDEAAVSEHAQRGGFPANRIGRVVRAIDPTTAHQAS